MQVTTDPCAIVRYATYQKNAREGGGDMCRGDGSPVEYVEIHDPLSSSVDEGVRRFTLDPTINGSRPPVGDVVHLILRDWMEPDAKPNGRGGAYLTRKRKNVVVSFTPAKS